MTRTLRWSMAAALAAGLSAGCTYYNAMWSAKRHASDARQLERRGQPADARARWAQAAARTKAWQTEDALVLRAEGLAYSGACRDAAALLTRVRASIQDWTRRERIDLAVVGPEVPLVAGLADRLAEGGITVFGPSARAAAIEGSKVFAKDLMRRHSIPTARFETFDDPGHARRYCRDLGAPLVVKADGLAAGKGAIVCESLEEADAAIADCMERKAFGVSGARVVVEEFMRGEEVSFFALANGHDAIALAAAQDHKTIFDGDRGPNTGGMGAFSPVGVFDEALEKRVKQLEGAREGVTT